jgi:hypothetical protein
MLRPQNHFQPARRRNFWNSSAIILIVNGMISLVLIGLVIGCPPAAQWISAAVQAEFAGITMPEPAPRQIAEPVLQTRTARND